MRVIITDKWDSSSSQAFFNTLIFIPAITVYYGVKLLFLKYPPQGKTDTLIRTLGGTTFGLFLIEQVCRRETKGLLSVLRPYTGTFPACCIWILSACLLGMGLTYLAKMCFSIIRRSEK